MRKYSVFLAVLLITPFNLSAADEYPTMDTVRFVLDCMSELGGMSEENLYSCSCRLDHIKSNMSFEKFEQATFFERYNKMPGKRGGLVRDSEDGPKLRKELTAVKMDADKHCPVVTHIGLDPDKKVIE